MELIILLLHGLFGGSLTLFKHKKKENSGVSQIQPSLTNPTNSKLISP